MTRASRLVARLFGRGRAPAPPAAPGEPAEAGLDLDFYRDWHPDLRGLDADALRRHWRQCGVGERRPPNLETVLQEKNLDPSVVDPRFDWRVYLSLYEDLRKADVATRPQALVHYLEHGIREGRDGVFNHRFYAGFYPDLVQFWDDPEAALRHWLEHGWKEGRSPSLRHYLVQRDVVPGAVPRDFEWSLPTEARERPGFWQRVANAFVQEPPNLEPVWGDADRDAAFYLDLAASYVHGGNDAKAGRLYVALADRYPGIAHRELGNIALRAGWRTRARQGQRDGCRLALAHYQVAERHDPMSWEVRVGRARALAGIGREAEALEVAGRALREHPGQSELERAVGRAAKACWRSEWATSDCLALDGQRHELFDTARAAAARLDRSFEAVALRGAATAVRARINRSRVLIVSDCNLPQCVRYRIAQKVEQLSAAGYASRVVSWSDGSEAWQALPLYDQVIFYRVPALPEVIRLASTARALGKVTFYEIDDLIFDPVYPPPIESYGGYVDAREYRDLLKGAALNHAAAGLCDFGIASTAPLQERLGRHVRRGIAYLHRNALDSLSPVDRIHDVSVAGDGVNFFYGSATRAHNSDFVEQALPALLRVLEQHPSAKLTIAGYLRLPADVVERLGDRLVQVPMQADFNAYLDLLSAAHVNLAVLHPDVMTDCKSELKWLEAGVMGIPSVVSPTRNYLDVVRDGVDALLAGTPDEWHAALSRLAADPGLRAGIGMAARARALAGYGVPAMASQLAAMLDDAADRTTADGGAVAGQAHG